MHKDCIILAYLLDISEVPILEKILEFLQQEHFCKIVYAIQESQLELEKWLLANYASYGIALDISKHAATLQSGEAIWHALPYCDTEDILIINPLHFIPFDIVALLSAQMLRLADTTILLPQNNTIQLSEDDEIVDGKIIPLTFNWSALVLFKLSFLSLNYATSFDIMNDYCKKNIENKHHIFGFANS